VHWVLAAGTALVKSKHTLGFQRGITPAWLYKKKAPEGA
jgi:hypothetical protein